MRSGPLPRLELPQELIERIIDCLSNDFGALKVCSLISKEWLPRARDHLFQSLSMPYRRSTPGFISMSEAEDAYSEMAEDAAGDIIKFLCFDSRISTSVKHLTLDCRGSDTFAKAFRRVVPFLPFTQLTSFRINMFPIDEMGQEGLKHLQTFLRANHAIETLSFESTGIDGGAASSLLRAAVPRLRNLRHLTLNNVGIYKTSGNHHEQSAVSERPRLESLSLAGGTYLPDITEDLFVDPSTAIFDLSELHTLRWSPRYIPLSWLNDILNACSHNSLVHLELELVLQDIFQSEFERPSIERLVNIERFTLRFYHKYHHEKLLLVLGFVASLASESSNLQHFTLHCHSPECRSENLLTSRFHELLVTIHRRLKGQRLLELVLPPRIIHENLAIHFSLPERRRFRIVESPKYPEEISG